MAQEREPQSLAQTLTYILEEARMLLPGIQGLFGFQLIAVFNQVFHERLSPALQVTHLVAIGLVAVCVTLVLAPAAYHRQVQQREVTDAMVRYASGMLMLAMFPLMLALCLDFFVIAMLILHERALSAALSIALFAVFFSLWFLWPASVGMRDRGRVAEGVRGAWPPEEKGK
jgi:hypothetical protein